MLSEYQRKGGGEAGVKSKEAGARSELRMGFTSTMHKWNEKTKHSDAPGAVLIQRAYAMPSLVTTVERNYRATSSLVRPKLLKGLDSVLQAIYDGPPSSSDSPFCDECCMSMKRVASLHRPHDAEVKEWNTLSMSLVQDQDVLNAILAATEDIDPAVQPIVTSALKWTVVECNRKGFPC